MTTDANIHNKIVVISIYDIITFLECLDVKLKLVSLITALRLIPVITLSSFC